MKKTLLLLTLISLCLASKAQIEDTVIVNKTVVLDSLTYRSLIQKPMPVSSTNTPASFTANDFINNLMDGFTYWTPFYEGHPTTLYVFQNAKSSADSILVAENSDNRYVFKKAGTKWLMTHFSITVSGFTLNHVACGQTSKEVLKRMGIKLKKPIANEQVWVKNKSGSYKFLLTFTNDKLTRIQL